MKIQVKELGGNNSIYAIDVSDDSTVGAVKEQIEIIAKIPGNAK